MKISVAPFLGFVLACLLVTQGCGASVLRHNAQQQHRTNLDIVVEMAPVPASSGNGTMPLLAQLEYELRMDKLPDVPDPVNKIHLGLIVGLGLGSCGLDRCLMGGFTTWALGIGCCKCITGGGCCIWACADFCVLAFSLVMMSPKIDMFWFEARFLTGTINWGCWTFVACFVIQCCGSALFRCFAWFSFKACARRNTSWVGEPSKAEVEHIFKKFDADSDGYLEGEEVDHALAHLGYPEMEWHGISERVDRNGDGKIDIEEFAAAFEEGLLPSENEAPTEEAPKEKDGWDKVV